ncbi:MAG TPA: hypothetical protein VJJ78_02095 [Candidatus Saccharimonadales bacterium]|nr:hypothetical protein [Candidatus Saccharimonadales bacterium]
MINLLPPEVKQDISFARRNTKLLRLSGVLLTTIIGMGLITISGTFYINRSINDYTDQVNQTREQLKAKKLEETQQRIDDISGSLRLVVKVLSQEVLFSELFKQIGSVIPPNSSLTDLKIGKIEGAIDLTAVATSYNAATQVQVNLASPVNKIFDKVDIVKVSCGGSVATDPKYPCVVNIRAQFVKNNPFLFINPQRDRT